jgi:hypothetical protein
MVVVVMLVALLARRGVDPASSFCPCLKRSSSVGSILLREALESGLSSSLE